MSKNFAPACERNKAPILEQLQVHFANATQVLEIGSGTGQHAIHFAKHLPHLKWHTSDSAVNHASIHAYLRDAKLNNLVAPCEFIVGVNDWPKLDVDAVFTANTTHIMQVHEAQLMMALVASHLPKGGVFCQYGPMKIAGDYTGLSDEEFDRHILAQGFGGIRDIEQLQQWAPGLILRERIAMPANNFLLVWRVEK
ncbi:Protein of unknown function [Vibrio xiamenensis]|uniref:DUF938 domain-containing protein n=1 Tax=Vibrio xiamenensis TaxID=861298 RepID=A0A1G8DXT2_9VIBR|nr:DUF938 domain-containing protein [Vibrio xiamenensis]SDH62532.1 Protein of unknown function [Vibrio xiamenensis]